MELNETVSGRGISSNTLLASVTQPVAQYAWMKPLVTRA
jgi:hypothetical protein